MANESRAGRRAARTVLAGSHHSHRSSASPQARTSPRSTHRRSRRNRPATVKPESEPTGTKPQPWNSVQRFSEIADAKSVGTGPDLRRAIGSPMGRGQYGHLAWESPAATRELGSVPTVHTRTTCEHVMPVSHASREVEPWSRVECLRELTDRRLVDPPPLHHLSETSMASAGEPGSTTTQTSLPWRPRIIGT